MRYPFGGWPFWLIALVPWLRVGKVIPGLIAGDPFNLAEAILDVAILTVGAALLAGRFAQPAVVLSATVLSVRLFPFLPPQSLELTQIDGVNWISGSHLGLRVRGKGDTSISLMLVSKSDRNSLVEKLKEHLSSQAAV